MGIIHSNLDMQMFSHLTIIVTDKGLLIDLCFYVHAGRPELRSEVDIIVADVGEPDSLAAMCKQAVIVLNCVGPVSRQLHRNVWPNSLSVSLASSLEHTLSYTQSCLHLNKEDH